MAIAAIACAVACVQRGLTVPDWFIALLSAVVAQYFSTRGASEATRSGAQSAAQLLKETI